MSNSNIACAILFVVSAFVQCAHSLEYTDLETLGIVCRDLENRFKCAGYSSSLDPIQRGCECDTACNSYQDCCINAPRRRPAARTSSTRNRKRCLHIGERVESGVFVVSTCKNNWAGLAQIRQKCEGADDYSDPLNAAPVTNVYSGITYRNRYCAECNDANMQNLTSFLLKMACPETEFMTDEQIYAALKYNSSLGVWGMDRWNSSRNATDFFSCDIIFDVPSYLINDVRFCKSNIISSCPPEFPRPNVTKSCKDYMAVTYDGAQGYRNPHCAICNGINVDELVCDPYLLNSRRKPMSFALLFDVNMSDGDQVGMRRVVTPECPSNQKYDPYFKKCRRLVCALPGFVVVEGKCVRR